MRNVYYCNGALVLNVQRVSFLTAKRILSHFSRKEDN